jgi:hypothetical protein
VRERQLDAFDVPVMSALLKAVARTPTVFDRTSRTRRDPARAKLRQVTGLSDEQIEGWHAMLRRNVRYPRPHPLCPALWAHAGLCVCVVVVGGAGGGWVGGNARRQPPRNLADTLERMALAESRAESVEATVQRIRGPARHSGAIDPNELSGSRQGSRTSLVGTTAEDDAAKGDEDEDEDEDDDGAAQPPTGNGPRQPPYVGTAYPVHMTLMMACGVATGPRRRATVHTRRPTRAALATTTARTAPCASCKPEITFLEHARGSPQSRRGLGKKKRRGAYGSILTHARTQKPTPTDPPTHTHTRTLRALTGRSSPGRCTRR